MSLENIYDHCISITPFYFPLLNSSHTPSRIHYLLLHVYTYICM